MDKNDSTPQITNVKLFRALLAERNARARRAKQIDAFIAGALGSIIVISIAAWPLMLGLHGVGVHATYGTCFLLVAAARITFDFAGIK